MYIVQGFLEAKPGKEEELEQTLRALIEPSRQEEGCIDYHLHRSVSNSTLFMFYENFVNEAAFKKHLETPYLQAWIAKKDSLLAKPNEVMVWELL